MATKITIKCNNSASKSVVFLPNGGCEDDLMVFVLQDGEFWFALDNNYCNLKNAKRAAIKKMAKMGYTFDEMEMENLNWK